MMKTSNDTLRRFREITDRWFDENNRLFPQDASEMGLHAFDGKLGENDSETHLAHRRLLTETLAGIEDLPDDAFRGDAWLDRRGMLALLRTELFFNRRERW